MKNLMTAPLSALTQAQKTILINNVQIFNGKDEKMFGRPLLMVNISSKIDAPCHQQKCQYVI